MTDPNDVDLKTTAQSHSSSPFIKRSPSSGTVVKQEPIVVEDDDDEIKPKDELDPTKIAQAKGRHEADLKKHAWEDNSAKSIQDDWQVAYVWAFIVKFQQMHHIRKLECLEDFERCLVEPVANRPDDILEGVLIRFLSNLKPASRNINCTNIQAQLSNYIADQLHHSVEFTVWDRPWAPNEETRGSCCTDASDRTELGRLRYSGEPVSVRLENNPIAQMEARGGGLFELDWRERAKLLRQLVDWQLTHADNIRGIIHKEYKISDSKAKKVDGLDSSIVTVPLGQDRDKARIWAFDNSGRVYKSGNPYKRPCPLIALSSNKTQMEALHQQYLAHGSEKPTKPKGSGTQGKQEALKFKKLQKGIDDEKVLAEKIGAMMPDVEKEEARIQRARKRVAQAVQLAQMAEVRTTRTRRSTKKVDYAYQDDIIEDLDDEPAAKRAKTDNGTWEGSSTRGKPVIPGERRSARVTAKELEDVDDEPMLASPIDPRSATLTNGAVSSDGRDKSVEWDEAADGERSKKRNKMKGWAWVEDPTASSEVKSDGIQANGVSGSTIGAATLGDAQPEDHEMTEMDDGQQAYGASPAKPSQVEGASLESDRSGLNVAA